MLLFMRFETVSFLNSFFFRIVCLVEFISFSVEVSRVFLLCTFLYICLLVIIFSYVYLYTGVCFCFFYHYIRMLHRLLFCLLNRLIFLTLLETFAFAYQGFTFQVFLHVSWNSWMRSSLSNSFNHLFTNVSSLCEFVYVYVCVCV